MTRSIAILAHESRPEAIAFAAAFQAALSDAAVNVVKVEEEFNDTDVELVVVIGGDGTLLKAAQLTYGKDVPLLGINYGHVGFLAEAEPSALPEVIDSVINRAWSVDTRMTIDIEIQRADGTRENGWALNEVSVEKAAHSRMIETDVGIDGRALSSFKTDAVLVSTPTGSTAYAFSAGAPVVWPDVEAMVLTPIAAHALFSRPLVVGPRSTLAIRVRSDDATIWCDGRREYLAPEGSEIRVVRGRHAVKLARLNDTPFTGRLVKKFNLPVEGWRVQHD